MALFHRPRVFLSLRVIGILGCIFSFCLSSGAWAGSDTGTLIVTLNTPTINGAITEVYRSYFIIFKRRDFEKSAHILYTPHSWINPSANDLASAGWEGTVETLELSAGDWAVTSFIVGTSTHDYIGRKLRETIRPKKDFSIPFKIRPGRATYIGNFQPIGQMSEGPSGRLQPGGVRFVIADKSARDVPIARAKKPDMGPVDVDVFDVDALRNPLLSSHDFTTGGAANDEMSDGNDEMPDGN